MAVGRAREQPGLQPLLAELLLVVGAQVLRRARSSAWSLSALEVLLAEARARASMRQRDVGEARPSCRGGRDAVKVVISLSTCASKLPAIGKSALLISSMRSRLRAGVGDHRRGERGQALLARGIVRGADAEEELHVELRQRRTSCATTFDPPARAAGRAGARPAWRSGRRRASMAARQRVLRRASSRTRPSSTKYFRAAACRSAGVSDVVERGSSRSACRRSGV